MQITKKQAEDYARCVEVQPTMTVEHFLELGLRLYNEGNDDLLQRIARSEARLYRKTHLKSYDVKSWSTGRSYSQGTEKWQRRDEAPLTTEDEQAIKAISMGQRNEFTGKAGDQFIQLDWACDSSD